LDLRIPGSLKIEHELLYNELNKAARERGQVGAAAMIAFRIFEGHVRKEEDFAFPPLDLLPSLAEKEVKAKAVESVIKLVDRLGVRLSELLKEHDEMRKALLRMNESAMREQKPAEAMLARRLLQHFDMEEQIFYPASMLAGKYIRDKLYGAHSLPLPR
jgi:iron-sulfur cluster repair protein YtfE (RIC family)